MCAIYPRPHRCSTMAICINTWQSADDASGGLDSKNLSKIQRWFNGPAFLCSSEKTWFCDKQSIEPVNEDDSELKNKLQLNIVKADITVTLKLEMISSSWIRIRKIIAVVLLAANIWIKKITKPRPLKKTFKTFWNNNTYKHGPVGEGSEDDI